jgi:hypothetical protein
MFQGKLIKFTSVSKKFKTVKYNVVKFRESVENLRYIVSGAIILICTNTLHLW